MDFRYITKTKGVGGRIKQSPTDFQVEEIGVNYQTKINYLSNKNQAEINWQEVFEKKKSDTDYLIVDLEKNNLATTSALNQLARFLQTSKKRFSFAGLKDKRAITSQRISIYQPSQDRLSKFNFKNIKIYNPFWSKDKIDIGDLKANKFTIKIRQITDFSKDDLKILIDQTISQINKNGLINYFGEQRFGGVREITHKVGKLLLLKRYKEAVILYLTEASDLEREDIKLAREDLKKDLNFRKHAANFPTQTGYESAILNYLANKPTDFLGAFKILPKSIQFLFIHAYQSYLFNELINLRIDNGYGLNPIEGDKIIDGEVYLPLFGVHSEFSRGLAGELEKEIIKKENISFKDFYNKEYSVLSSKGDFRKIKTSVNDLKIISIEDDKDNTALVSPLEASLSFILDKGQYATVVLREIIKKEMIG
ncbi:tRNA pseudouridine(13) synthase TruD [archaeon]|nr:tRNA pseudouridine(13) synthase TruD [archaeon]